MWMYSQSAGRIWREGDPAVYPLCYSGKNGGKNNPALQSMHNVGPIPQGVYGIGPPQDTKTHGPYVLPLIPKKGNVMWGRSGFLMHSDSVSHPGQASEGCIVCARSTRVEIWESGDHQLTVVA